MSARKLLFLCQVLPYPPDTGVAVRSFNILRLLAETYDVTALCFFRRGSTHSITSALQALSFAQTQAFPIEQEHSRLRLLRDHFMSVTTSAVYTRFAYESRSFERAMTAELSSQTFDLIHYDSLDLSAYLPLARGLPAICGHHNVESDLLERRATVESNRFRRAYLSLQARLMRREESYWCSRVALNTVVSPVDAAVLAQRAPAARIAIVPNGVDTQAFRPADRPGTGLVFVGGMTWFPNRDAYQYFRDSILPILRKSATAPSVIWVGRARDEDYVPADSCITLTGHVPDIRPYVHAAACFIVPLRVGGGSRLKILDAWAMGKAVVSTSVGCEGLDAKDGWNIMIRDEPAAFADAILEVVGNTELQRRLGENARATVETTYSWEVIKPAMIDAYEQVRTGQVPT